MIFSKCQLSYTSMPIPKFAVLSRQSAFYPQSAVLILHFAPRLHFTLSLQSAFYPHSAFYPWSAVCTLRFTLTDHTCNLPRAFICVLWTNVTCTYLSQFKIIIRKKHRIWQMMMMMMMKLNLKTLKVTCNLVPISPHQPSSYSQLRVKLLYIEKDLP